MASLLALLTAASLTACDDRPPRDPPDEPPRPVPRRVDDAGLAALLGLDAGEIPELPQPDPPAPAGDLKSEVDSFTSLDACVASRADFDPVVGDAVDVLGYDTLKRDACRVLQAANKKDVSLCEAILASSLRQHCTATVAVTTGDPLLCPMVGTNHDPLCIALARRDDRLCVTTAPSDRLLCQAVLAREPTLCRRDARCARRVERWKSFLPERIERPDLGTRATVHVAEVIEGGTLPAQAFDLARAIQGATVRESPKGRHVELGDTSSVAWPPASILTTPRFLLRMMATKEVTRQGRHPAPQGAVEFELLLPHRGKLATDTIEGPLLLDVDMFGTDIGDPVRFTLEARVGPSHRKFHVKLVINTFVRDVVKVGSEGSPGGTP
jgi:hypothetical protein